jgi:hypothetical protein
VSGKEFEGAIGVPKKGELVNLTTLTNGIVAKQTVLLLDSGIALDAVIEKNRQIDMNRVIEVIEERGKELYNELGTLFETLDTESESRVRELLLEYCLQTRNKDHVRGMKVFKQVDGQNLSLGEVKTLAQESKLFAISSDDLVTGYELGSKRVLILGELERRFIETFLKKVPTSPPSLLRRSGFELNLPAKIKSVLSCIFRNLPARPGRLVPDEELEQGELSFLGSVRKQLNKTDDINIYMSEDQRRLIAQSRGKKEAKTYYISRFHKEAQQMVTAVSLDQLYVFPSLELLGGSARFRRTSVAFCGRNNDA